MSNERKLDGEELDSQQAALLPDREAMSLINPAPGDMPVDPPLVPTGPLPPVEETQ
jgi:hypothetical protein